MTESSVWGHGSRVSDSDRNEVVERLAEHFAAGRLNKVEFDERMDQALSARFEGELAQLLADLPTEVISANTPVEPRGRWSKLTVPVGLVVIAAVAAVTFWPSAFYLVLVAFFVWRRASRSRNGTVRERRTHSAPSHDRRNGGWTNDHAPR